MVTNYIGKVMKFKDLETAKKYFWQIFQEDKLPSKITKWNENFTDAEHEKFVNLWEEDERIKSECLVVSDDSELYYYENYLAYAVGHSRRCQWYYLLCHTKTLEVSIFATSPDGSGSDVSLPKELITWIINGDVML